MTKKITGLYSMTVENKRGKLHLKFTCPHVMYEAKLKAERMGYTIVKYDETGYALYHTVDQALHDLNTWKD